MIWAHNYDPFGATWLSALLAAAPVAVLLGGLAFFHIRAHVAALLGLMTALVVAIAAFEMPSGLAFRAAGFGAAYGLLPIGWIVLNIIFLYRLTEERGQFEILRNSISRVTDDSRLQLLLIAFCFGAFFEGAAGFGTPVAVTGAMLIGLGFTRLQASGLSLIANTAPVAFGALGTPLLTLAAITDLPLLDLSAMVGRQMTPFAFIVPWWMLVAYCGWRRTLEIWPAVLVTSTVFALTQLGISNLHGPWLTAIGSALASIAALVLFLRRWRPAHVMHVNEAPLSKHDERVMPSESTLPSGGTIAVMVRTDAAALRKAWMPWLILTATVFVWGIPAVKAGLDSVFKLLIPVPGLEGMIMRVPPVVPVAEAEKAVFSLNLLSATGSAILFAAVVSGLLLGVRPAALAGTYFRALKSVTPSLLTIAAMLALGYVTRYSGIDAAMGLAFAHSGVLYPLLGTLLGWLGVAVTGSDTASNVLFGGLQKVTAEQLGISPVLMTSANSAGGVMGKMIDAQSIVVASTATRWFGAEGTILRYVFMHSIVLACLIGLVVMLMAYVPPFTALVVS
jgi:lactate permease